MQRNGLRLSHAPQRDNTRRAAALRWVMARERDSEARVHDLLEFDAASRVLARLEELHPGLREFVDCAEVVAACAADVQAAEQAGTPSMMTSAYRQALDV